jgi:AcrR family transcriptional regulator
MILDTALQLFDEHGYDATSLQMIADAVGVTKANVYYYFRTKHEILQATVSPAIAQINALLDQAETIRGKRARTRHVVDGAVELIVSHRKISVLSNTDPAVRREKDIDAQFAEVRERGLRVLYGATPTVYERTAYSVVFALADIIASMPDVSDDELRRALTQLCLRILADR